MAIITFEEAYKQPVEFTVITNTGKIYSGYFSDLRIDRSSLPPGWNAYDIREDDITGAFGTIESKYILVNHAGTFYMQGEIEELSSPNAWVNLKIDEELHSDAVNYPDDWDYTFGPPAIYRGC